MTNFTPDYNRLVAAARNQSTRWIPLYEHIVGDGIIGAIMGKDLTGMREGNEADREEYFRIYCQFYRQMGYDTVSFEGTMGLILPNSDALTFHTEGAIHDRADFDAYPWDEIEPLYFEQYGKMFQSLRRSLPPGMKAVGGVGNGVFECVEELVGYMDLCYMIIEDPELCADLFDKMGEISLRVWQRFLREYGDIFCVCRFGDDLGFKTSTLVSPDSIRTLILPQYRRIVAAVHEAGKPFLLHSCGKIFPIMDDLIEDVGIDAKHSNEDQIAMFPEWVERYGDRIGNFGGIDTDAVCRLPSADMEDYIRRVVEASHGRGGFAFGSGNSIPDYVPVDQYVNMNSIIRRIRSE